MTLPQFHRYLAAAELRNARTLKRTMLAIRAAVSGGEPLRRLLKALPD